MQNQFIVGAATLSAIRNAGRAYSQGLEIEAVARPVPALTVNATATFAKAIYTDYITSAPPNYPAAPAGFSLAGKRVPFTPKVKFTFGGRYDIDLGNAGVLTPSANAIVSSSYYNTDYNTVLDIQKAYAKVDLRLGWRGRGTKAMASICSWRISATSRSRIAACSGRKVERKLRGTPLLRGQARLSLLRRSE